MQKLAHPHHLKLPSHIRTADVFNVKHLIPFADDSLNDDNLGANSVKPGENDVDAQALAFIKKYEKLRYW